MIDHLIGIIKELRDQEVVIDLGIVGVTLGVPTSTVFEMGKKVQVYVYVHWNAENGPTLFGFINPLERTVFQTILSCSGIGPKIGLAILAHLGVQGFLQAIQTADDHMLSKVNGIGKKKAETIIVQLKHKVSALIESGVDLGNAQETAQFHEVSQVLQSLNYSRSEINHAMEYVKKSPQTGTLSFDQLLRQALSYLSKSI